MTIMFGSRSQFVQCETGCVVWPSDSLGESFLVISRRAVAITTSSGVIDQEYLDETLEPIANFRSRTSCGDRSGRREVDEEVLRQRFGISTRGSLRGTIKGDIHL